MLAELFSRVFWPSLLCAGSSVDMTLDLHLTVVAEQERVPRGAKRVARQF